MEGWGNKMHCVPVIRSKHPSSSIVIHSYRNLEIDMKTKQLWAGRWARLCRIGILGMLSAAGVATLAQTPASAPEPTQAKQPAVNPAATDSQAFVQKAWGILREGTKDKSPDKRAGAVRALGLLPGSSEAEKGAIDALQDKNPKVRVAAAAALGSMHAQHANLELEGALQDSEPTVVLAAANSLLLLHDKVGYDIYYDVLTGERRASKGLVKEQIDTLKDKKKMAQMGFEEGIGFIPFAGMGYEAFKTVTKNDASPIRAAAAKQLAHDPDPGTSKALVKATTDKNWAVRAAALEALALRDDRSVVPQVAGALDDEKDVVRFTAAACVVHLSELPEKESPAKNATP
jgi:HEAT repeat protein